MTMQYIKTDGNGDLAIPIEVCAQLSTAVELWGDGNYVYKDIPDNVCTRCLKAELDQDGEVQVDQTKVDAEQAVKDADNLHAQRHIFANDVRDNIDVATGWDSLTTIEKKVVLNRMPTDQEFIDAGYTFP